MKDNKLLLYFINMKIICKKEVENMKYKKQLNFNQLTVLRQNYLNRNNFHLKLNFRNTKLKLTRF